MNTNTAISPSEAIEALKDLVTEYTLNSIKSQLFQREHTDQKESFEKKYGWSHWSTSGQKAVIHTSKSFADRAEAMKWIADENLGEPVFSKISFATSKGEPKTLCTLKCVGEFEGTPFEIEANYTRDGLPTKNCRVQPSISYSVVCDLNK